MAKVRNSNKSKLHNKGASMTARKASLIKKSERIVKDVKKIFSPEEPVVKMTEDLDTSIKRYAKGHTPYVVPSDFDKELEDIDGSISEQESLIDEIFDCKPNNSPFNKLNQEVKTKEAMEFITKSIENIQVNWAKIHGFLNSEYKRKLSSQAHVGEAVLYEILTQSYELPIYSVEERYKRLISVVQEALRTHKETPAFSIKSENTQEYQERHPDDPHGIDIIEPDTSNLSNLWETAEELLSDGEGVRLAKKSTSSPEKIELSVQVDGQEIGTLETDSFHMNNNSQTNINRAETLALPHLHEKVIAKVISYGKTINIVTRAPNNKKAPAY